MAGTLLEELKQAVNLSALWRLHRGTLLDSGNNSLGALTVVGTPTPCRSTKAPSVYMPHAGSSYLTPGNPAALQLSTFSLFVACARTETTPANFSAMLSKISALSLYHSTAPEPVLFGAWDYTGAAFRASTFRSSNNGAVNFFGVSFVSGLANGLAFYGNGVPNGTATATIANQAGNWAIGQTPFAGEGLGGSVLIAGVVNRVLTSAEHARLYVEWLREYSAMDLPRRGFVYKYPSKSNAEYAAAGIVLDTDFGSEMNGSTRRIRDLANNYPGTITGTPVPGQNGEGQKAVVVTDLFNFGDVAQLNNATKFSIGGCEETPSANIPVSYFATKYQNANNYIQIGCIDIAAAVKRLYFGVGNAAASLGNSTATQIRAGTRQHWMCVFNGGGSGDAGRSQMYIDGELVPQTYVLAVPASVPNLAGVNFLTGYTNITTPATYLGQRVYAGVALTPDQVRDEYLQCAKRLVLRETLEDVPVSLVASVAAGGKIGPWDVISGTWKCSETSDGKRWLECVTAGCAVRLQPHAFGTFEFVVMKVNDPGFWLIHFNAAYPLAYNDASQSGYCITSLAAESVVLARVTAGGLPLFLTQTANAYISVGTAYRFTISRRPSDGRFTTHIQGGAYVQPTLMSVAGGSGSNPSAGETTYVDSKWIGVNMSAGDKLCLYDPRDPTVAFNVYQGCLNPTMGELPGSTLLNMLRWSDDYTQAAFWLDGGPGTITVTANQYTSPFGTPADKLEALVGAGGAYIYQTVTTNVGAQYTHSVYVKAIVGTQVMIDLWNAPGYAQATFDLTTGALVTLATFGLISNYSAGSESLGAGWYRLWVSAATGAGSTTFDGDIYLLNLGDTLAVCRSQLVQGPCAGRYVERQ